jgi:hypothetical protein
MGRPEEGLVQHQKSIVLKIRLLSTSRSEQQCSDLSRLLRRKKGVLIYTILMLLPELTTSSCWNSWLSERGGRKEACRPLLFLRSLMKGELILRYIKLQVVAGSL